MESPSVSPVPAMDRRVERPKWKRWAPFGIAGVVIVAIAITGWLVSSGSARGVAIDDIEIAAVKAAPFQDFVPSRGLVTPSQSIFLDALEGGRVERLHVTDGAVVQAGALLAELSNPDLERQVGATEAEISARIGDTRGQMLQIRRSRVDRERELDQARYELLQADQNLQIRRGLHERGFVSDAEIQRLTAEVDHRRRRVNALEASARPEAQLIEEQSREIGQSVTQLNQNLRSVRGSLGALQIRAPTSGRLTAFELQLGQTVQAGQRIGQIDSEGAWKLTAQIDEFYLGRVNIDQTAAAVRDGQTYRMRVSRLVPQVVEGRFQIELVFLGPVPTDMRRGQNLDVELTLGATKPALVIPNSAFMQAGGGSWVFVLDRSGRRAERRTIRTGRRNPQFVEVLGGLRPGERIITSSYEGFSDDARLNLR